MKKRNLILAVAILAFCSAHAQKSIPRTDTLFITGQVLVPTTFTLAALDTFPEVDVADHTIYNHDGVAKSTLTGISGIPLKAVLASTRYVYNEPRDLNEFYFVLTASDGYKAVFSWNEIYNTAAGNSLFIITKMDGKKLADMEQRILSMAASDLKTGRRYVKGLKTIDVRRIE